MVRDVPSFSFKEWLWTDSSQGNWSHQSLSSHGSWFQMKITSTTRGRVYLSPVLAAPPHPTPLPFFCIIVSDFLSRIKISSSIVQMKKWSLGRGRAPFKDRKTSQGDSEISKISLQALQKQRQPKAEPSRFQNASAWPPGMTKSGNLLKNVAGPVCDIFQ